MVKHRNTTERRFRKSWKYPQIIQIIKLWFGIKTHSDWGYPYFRKPPYCTSIQIKYVSAYVYIYIYMHKTLYIYIQGHTCSSPEKIWFDLLVSWSRAIFTVIYRFWSSRQSKVHCNDMFARGLRAAEVRSKLIDFC